MEKARLIKYENLKEKLKFTGKHFMKQIIHFCLSMAMFFSSSLRGSKT